VVDEKNVGQGQPQGAPKSDDQIISEMFNAALMQVSREFKILYSDLINFLVQKTKAPQVPAPKVEPKVEEKK